MKLPAALASYFDSLSEERLQISLRCLQDDFSCEGGTFDLITDCFLDNDATLFENAIPWLQEAVQEAAFMDSILRLERNRLEGELERLHIDPTYNRREIEFKKRELDDVCFESLQERALRSYDDFCSTLVAAKDFAARQCKNNFFLTKLLRIVYEAHCAEQREERRYMRVPQKSTQLYQYYKAAEVDLLETDTQYSKYNLYSVTLDTKLLIGIPNRILDPQRPLQLLIENTPEHVLRLFERLRNEGLIKDLALLASNDVLIETDKHIFVTLGYQIITVPLTVDNLPRQPDGTVLRTVLRKSSLPNDSAAVRPSVSTFYRPDSEDKTWCSITANSMTFEEIAHVPELLEDCAVTRMIHLEYFIDGGRLFVSHIDHEFIFYTHEEFDLRADDFSQKGNARKRLKTFKIDRSAIPFMLDDGTLFVHTLIDACFEKPYLLMDFLLDLLQQD
ncbi:hypothetical protein PMI27_004709 [Pseudomonas sp. GM41(2012)]|uniref:hypothetical protein n=1 Tax=Pseudomonas sp. (strain GM41(2012)) TaxID=1144708 RepID=UPI00026FEF56|nr:hypothetical protein [Pseudomonas sp. GM41(2012)]EUB72787.1 hypothetical protein PMI27_004709 [Pseudomonas sp. GM41(2012)]